MHMYVEAEWNNYFLDGRTEIKLQKNQGIAINAKLNEIKGEKAVQLL